MRRVLLILVGLLVVILMIWGVVALVRSRGASQEKGPITIKLWSPFDEGETYDKIVKPIIANRPDITFEFKYVQAKDAAEYEAKVVDAIAAGNGPDIWLIRNDWLPKHQTKLAPSPIAWSSSSKITEADALKALFTENVVKQNSLDGKLYGVPLAIDSLALYINRDVVNQARRDLAAANRDEEIPGSYPKTWAQAEQWSRLITKKSGKNIERSGLAMGTTSNTYAATDVLMMLLAQRKVSLYAEDHKEVTLHLSKEVNGQATYPAQEALEFFTSFARPDHENYAWNAEQGDPIQAFLKGKLAMFVGYSSLINQMRKADTSFDSAVIAPLPQLEEQILPMDKRTDYAAYWTHVVNKNSSQSELAWRILKSLTNKDALRQYSRDTTKVTLTQIRTETKVTGSGDFADKSIFAAQMVRSTTMYQPNWQEVSKILQDMINQRQSSGQSSQGAIDGVVERLRKLVQ